MIYHYCPHTYCQAVYLLSIVQTLGDFYIADSHCHRPKSYSWILNASTSLANTPSELEMHVPQFVLIYPTISRVLIFQDRAGHSSQANNWKTEYMFWHTFTWLAKHTNQVGMQYSQGIHQGSSTTRVAGPPPDSQSFSQKEAEQLLVNSPSLECSELFKLLGLKTMFRSRLLYHVEENIYRNTRLHYELAT